MTFTWLLCLFLSATQAQDLTSTTDIKTLSELPLERLLQVRNSLSDTQITDEPISEDGPNALALKSKNPIKRGDYEHDEKGHGIQTIFQTSVTALAFLAFGGYLVCLITQAIRGHTNMDQPQVIVMESLVKRPLRIKRPNTYNRNSKRRRPNQRHKRDVLPESNPERMYDALVMLSEAYTKYHTSDYRRYNWTIKTEL